MPLKLHKIHYRNHNSSGSYVRVWNDNWAGDQFDVVSRDSFLIFQSMLRGVVEFVEHDDSEDSEA